MHGLVLLRAWQQVGEKEQCLLGGALIQRKRDCGSEENESRGDDGGEPNLAAGRQGKRRARARQGPEAVLEASERGKRSQKPPGLKTGQELSNSKCRTQAAVSGKGETRQKIVHS
ncbi:uncharacterized protein UTRI_04045 [Ustilago trichophora]|uniref:Uncharacterized protein n=1 Tax=Ustilago trichophora TaxID=86804 RepID=A0A5C3EAB0_9BASI|nr:uncharacterized protein UTRI_04045 [Ustilago trichophora]